jgi:hypothetical protein
MRNSMKYICIVNGRRNRARRRLAWLILALTVGLPIRRTASQEVLGGSSGGQERTGIAFDQIDRALLHGAAPPPIDSFAADAAVISSLPPLKAEAPTVGGAVARGVGTMLVSSALSFIPLAGPFVAGVASRSLNAVQQAEQQHQIEKQNAAVAHFINAGTISHFAFYRGWIRSEQRGTLTIVKPDQSLAVVANLSKKTMRVIDERTSGDTIVIDTTEELAQPALVGEIVIERLPDATISGHRARGYRTTANIDLKSAVNWCAPGRHLVVQMEYVTDLPDPQPEVTTEGARALTDGCEPLSTASYREHGRLVLYRATSIDPNTPRGVTLMFERGNLDTLGENSVSLFSAPADFKKEQ